MQINSSLPEGSFAHVFLQEYESRLEAAAPGEIDVQIFMSNTLGKEEDVLQGLGFGTHQASLSASAVAQINTRTAIFDLPYLFEDRAAVQAFASTAPRARCWPKASKAPAWCWPRCGTTASARSPTTCAHRDAADLDGLKIRTPTNRQRVEMFNTLGANATPLSSARSTRRSIRARSTGRKTPRNVVDTAKLFEVQGYMSLSNHVYLPTFLVIGEPFLASLETNCARR
jgi:TRAP-type C4-dicarboxylate transport system substrate-binding protein